jgi:hypothetical protein
VTDHVEAERNLRLINLELTHRVKNTLAIVSAIASQTLRVGATDRALKSFQERLRAFGTAHDILTDANKADASIRQIVEGILEAHIADRARYGLGPGNSAGLEAIALAGAGAQRTRHERDPLWRAVQRGRPCRGDVGRGR